MKILVLNAGSSSLKFQLFEMESNKVVAKGNCEKIGLDGAFLKYKAHGTEKIINAQIKNHNQAIELVLKTLQDKEIGVIKSMDEIDAVGHRVVHGGEIFKKSVLIDEKVMKEIEDMTDLAPLHQPANIAGIKACQRLINVPNVAVFDTAFHAQMPDYAYIYGIPYDAYKDWKIRKYGFHGTSHRYVSGRVAEIMGKPIEDLKIITVHVGNGSSITAVQNGHSVDTTMGLTPLDGLVMGTRCGSIDPSIIEFINKKTGWSIEEITKYLNKKSGMLGLNGGKTSDMRENNTLIEQGDKGAKLFLDILAYQIKKYIGAFAAAMGGVDAIAFTGGIGENQEDIREKSTDTLKFMGIEVDHEKNWHLPRGTEEEISTKSSKVKVFRIPTDEELAIARDTEEIAKNAKKSK